MEHANDIISKQKISLQKATNITNCYYGSINDTLVVKKIVKTHTDNMRGTDGRGKAQKTVNFLKHCQ
jgi:hypothetical protein